jgi:hypothetical protein
LKEAVELAVVFVLVPRICGIEIPEKTGVGAAYAWASWGAAVLRPYMMLLGGKIWVWCKAEILRFATG